MDLDGTVCTQENSDTYHLAKPLIQTVKKINCLYADGHRIVIFTARGMVTCDGDVSQIEGAYREMTEKWLNDNRVCYDELIFGKPAGDYYVDDKSLTPDKFVSFHDDTF